MRACQYSRTSTLYAGMLFTESGPVGVLWSAWARAAATPVPFASASRFGLCSLQSAAAGSRCRLYRARGGSVQLLWLDPQPERGCR